VTIVEEYVAAVERRDAADRNIDEHEIKDHEEGSSEERDDLEDHSPPADGSAVEQADEASTPASATDVSDSESATVGVKAHKKGGAVGDADSDDDDDDDDDSEESDWEEFEEDLEMMVTPTQLEVEVEFVEDEDHAGEEVATTIDSYTARSANSGGVGIALGHRFGRRTNRGRSLTATTTVTQSSPVKEKELLEAWLPHVYLPPSKGALSYLSENARMIAGASKSRLDRRTLYACLMIEWLNVSASYRRFLEKDASQALQSALSLATQPQWRKCSSQRLCGIRLYDSEIERGCTLAMQETIVMALVSDDRLACYSDSMPS
jgi:hypothetical protein